MPCPSLGRKYAWGQDELLPLSQQPSTWFDLALTLVDALDTLILLGLDQEYSDVSTHSAFLSFSP